MTTENLNTTREELVPKSSLDKARGEGEALAREAKAKMVEERERAAQLEAKLKETEAKLLEVEKAKGAAQQNLEQEKKTDELIRAAVEKARQEVIAETERLRKESEERVKKVEVKLFLEKSLSTANLQPEFADLVSGNTEDEITESIKIAKAKQESLIARYGVETAKQLVEAEERGRRLAASTVPTESIVEQFPVGTIPDNIPKNPTNLADAKKLAMAISEARARGKI